MAGTPLIIILSDSEPSVSVRLLEMSIAIAVSSRPVELVVLRIGAEAEDSIITSGAGSGCMSKSGSGSGLESRTGTLVRMGLVSTTSGVASRVGVGLILSLLLVSAGAGS